MSYPKYNGKTAFSLQISALDSYFTTNTNPGKWHPDDFAQGVSATSMDPFVKGLELIGRCGNGSIPMYANTCTRFLRTVAGKETLADATKVIELRLSNKRKTLAEKTYLLNEDARFYGNLSKVY